MMIKLEQHDFAKYCQLFLLEDTPPSHQRKAWNTRKVKVPTKKERKKKRKKTWLGNLIKQTMTTDTRFLRMKHAGQHNFFVCSQLGPSKLDVEWIVLFHCKSFQDVTTIFQEPSLWCYTIDCQHCVTHWKQNHLYTIKWSEAGRKKKVKTKKKSNNNK